MKMDSSINKITLKLSEFETKSVHENTDLSVNEEKVVETEDEENHTISDETIFKCDQCDFVSIRNIGLKIHMGKLHKAIIQVDGNASLEEEIVTSKTSRYWSTGVMGMMFQTYGDVIKEIMESELEEDEKSNEIEIAKKSRLKSWVDIGMPAKTCNF